MNEDGAKGNAFRMGARADQPAQSQIARRLKRIC
jgi:hypothetical protein